MKKLFTLLLALVATTALWAEDFSVGGIYYNILTYKTNEVEVTYRGDQSDSYSNEYSGSVTIPSSVTYNGTTYSVTSIGDDAFYHCSGLTSVTIPNSVTRIGYRAFYECSRLTSVTIPNSVTSIGNSAFYRCYGLTSITIPNSVTEIGRWAFYYCESLTSVTIGNSVKSIGWDAFGDCSGLTSITIPNSVTSIGDLAFSGCSGLTSIVVEKGNTVYDSRENCNAIIETATNTLIAGCQNTIIPSSVTSIGDYAFYHCSSLTSITIPNSVTTIGDDAFGWCSGLTSITIPNSVTSIGNRALSDCSSLTSIIVEDANSTYDSRENCNAIIKTATNTLIVGCQNTIIPNSVTSIGSSAFEGCKNLTSITIPNSVTNIGEYAFDDCKSLASVTIGNSITSIGDYAFYNCYGLTSVTSLAEIPPTLGTDVFYKVSNNIPVYVRCGTVSAYQSAEGWKDFTNIQCMPEDESAVDNVHSQSTNVQKLIRDGQLLIIRDGKTYNAQGVEL